MSVLSEKVSRSPAAAGRTHGIGSEASSLPPVWLGLLTALGVAVVFTLIVVHWSLEHGRLSTLANWDDSMYLAHGWIGSATLEEKGLIKFLGFERSWPPHSIYSDLQCMAGFLLFGFQDSSPYYFGFVSVTAALVLLGMLARWQPVATGTTWLLFLATPMAFQMVHMVKADVACGVWFVMGAALLLDGDLISMPLWELGFRLVPFFVAVLCRPPGLIYLGPLFAACWGIAWGREWLTLRADGKCLPWPAAFKRFLMPGVALVLLAPYYLFAYRWFQGYLLDAYLHRAWYSPPRPLWEELGYYFEPRIYNDATGIAIAIGIGTCIGLVVAALRSREQNLRATAWFWCASTGIAWIGLTVAYYKTPLIGSTFYLFLFCALPILWSRLRSGAGRTLAGAVVFAGFLFVASHTQWSNPDEWYGGGRTDPRTRILGAASTRVVEIARDACLQRAGSNLAAISHSLKVNVFFTSDAFLNAENFEYEMAKAGYWKVHALGLDFSADLEEHVAEARKADLVIACDGGANWPYPGNRPADRLQDAVLAVLKADPQFLVLGETPSIGGKSFYVFQNLQRTK